MHKIFKKILRQNVGIFLLNVIVGIFASVMLSRASYQLSHLFDGLEQASGDVMTTLKMSVVKIFLLFCTAILLIIVSGLIDAKYVCRMSNDLRAEMTSKFLYTSYDFFDEKNTGNFVSWFTNDAKTLTELSVQGYSELYRLFAMAVSSFVAMCLLNKWLGLIAIGFLLLSLFVPQIFQGVLQKEQQKVSLQDEKFTEKMRDLIHAYPVFLLTDKLKKFRTDAHTASEEREEAVKHASYVQSGVQGISMMMSLFAQIGMTVVSVYFSLKGEASLGAAFAAASLSGTLFNGILQFVQALMKFKSAIPIYEKYEYEVATGHEELGHLTRIDLRNIRFGYGDSVIFDQFSRSFEAGKKYAVIGVSGSGKTTLLKLILGFVHPEDGEVLLNQKTLQTLSRSSVYHKIGYIDQNPILLKGTLRENLTLGMEKSEEEILEVLKITELSKFLEKKSDGLDTVLEENGKNISGGEKERIAIARALLMGAEFLLVDEATAQLDDVNAVSIENMLLSREGLGFIMISHHFTEESLQKFDEVIRI